MQKNIHLKITSIRKILFFLALISITMAISCSKQNDAVSSSTVISSSAVPASVMSNFNSRYPSAGGQIEWEKENGNTYKVKFFLGSQRWQALFAPDGSFISEKMI
ncbi:MAG: hypothetical protein IPJ02_03470 [Chitinophagaceae bacterium]|nr:hypothetical protein [Chitinophagaceae bacterium]